jgi:signal transduction histidine kinase
VGGVAAMTATVTSVLIATPLTQAGGASALGAVPSRAEGAPGTVWAVAPKEKARRDVLIQAGMVLVSELSLPSILQKIVDLACQVADARYGGLGVLGEDGLIADFITHGVTEEERRAIGHLPVGKGILGVLIHEAHPLRLPRIQSDPRSVGFPPNHPPMTSFLGVPLRVRDHVYGNLYLTEKVGGAEFTREDEEAVVTLAAQAGVAIENARIREELERLAVLEDRERIAKDLHDGVVQALFAVGMSLQAGASRAEDPAAVRTRLQEAVEAIDGVIRDLRNYIFGLGPAAAADRELDRALRELAGEFRRGTDVAIAVDVDRSAAETMASRGSDVVQAAREALSNAIRHAQPHTVSLQLRRDAGGIALEVEDDGVGFDPGAVAAGRGLGNLRARAAALGGELEIESDPGGGTTVRIVVPA